MMGTELKNFEDEPTNTAICLTPFLFTESKIFSKSYGFINAYSQDINRPFLEQHVIYLFKYCTDNINELDEFFNRNTYFFNRLLIRINGELYIRYTMVICEKEIINALKYPVSQWPAKEKCKIISFWKNISNYYFFYNLFNSYNDTQRLYDTDILPEEDIFDDCNNLNILN